MRRKRLEARAVPGCFARRALRSLPPSCWRKRGKRQRGPPASRPGQCGPVREGAGGRVSATQSAAATAKRTCWSPALPPLPIPPPAHGTEQGPAASACARPAQPRRLGRSPFLLGLRRRRLPSSCPLRPRALPAPGPTHSRLEVYVTGGPGSVAAATRTWTPSTPSTRR